MLATTPVCIEKARPEGRAFNRMFGLFYSSAAGADVVGRLVNNPFCKALIACMSIHLFKITRILTDMSFPLLITPEDIPAVAFTAPTCMPFLIMMNPVMTKRGDGLLLSADGAGLNALLRTGRRGFLPGVLAGCCHRSGLCRSAGAASGFLAGAGTGGSLRLLPCAPAVRVRRLRGLGFGRLRL